MTPFERCVLGWREPPSQSEDPTFWGQNKTWRTTPLFLRLEAELAHDSADDRRLLDGGWWDERRSLYEELFTISANRRIATTITLDHLTDEQQTDIQADVSRRVVKKRRESSPGSRGLLEGALAGSRGRGCAVVCVWNLTHLKHEA